MSSSSSRSSPDAVATALRDAAVTVIDAVTALPASAPVVIVDGRSGAGKTSLVRAIVARWPRGVDVQVVALDSVYPGWDGLQAGAEAARDLVLRPHAAGRVGTWRRWDWGAGRYSEAHDVDPRRPLIVEGAGALQSSTAEWADVRVWLESPTASRKDRAIARDGETYAPHWDRWARQEAEHIARHRPSELATHVFEVP